MKRNLKPFVTILLFIFTFSESLGKSYSRERVVIEKGVSLAQQLCHPNTVYIVRGDFDLGDFKGDNLITIPDECILQFDGGSLKNGVIVGRNTSIRADVEKIFGEGLSLKGSWNVVEAYPEWFGAKGDGIANDTEPIQKVFDCFETVNLTKDYRIDKLTIRDSRVLKSSSVNTLYTQEGVVLGDRCSIIAPNLTLQSLSEKDIDILRVGSKNTIILYGIIGKRPATTKYGSNTKSRGVVCNQIIFSKIRLHRIQYCKNGIYLFAGKDFPGDPKSGDTLNKLEIDVTWIADCLYGIYQGSVGSSEQANVNAYIEYCNTGWYVKDMFIGCHNIHFDDVNKWFEVYPGHNVSLGMLYLKSIRYSTFLAKTEGVIFGDTHIFLKDYEWHKPLTASSADKVPRVKTVNGFFIYRTDKRQPSWWDEKSGSWVGADGINIEDQRTGKKRPIGVPVGFMFFDTSINMPIWYIGGDSWVDAMGNSI